MKSAGLGLGRRICGRGGGSVAVAPDSPWFGASFTAVVTAIAIALLWKPEAVSRRSRVTAAIATLLASLTLYAAHAGIERRCTALDASGRRVVIGTELTPSGKNYVEVNPHDNNDAILQSLGKLGPEVAWTAASIGRCRVQVAVTQSLWLPLLGIALVCAVSLPAGRCSARLRGRRVFISYNHEDAATARRLRDALAAERPRRDARRRHHGAGRRIRIIERSIRDSDVVVSIVSPEPYPRGSQ